MERRLPRSGWTSLLLIFQAPRSAEILDYFVPGARVPSDLVAAARRLLSVEDAAEESVHWAAYDRFMQDLERLSDPDRESAELLRSSLAWITSGDHMSSGGLMMLIEATGRGFIDRLPPATAAAVGTILDEWSSARRRLIGRDSLDDAEDEEEWQPLLGLAMDKLAVDSFARELRNLPEAQRRDAVDALERDAKAKGLPPPATALMTAPLRQ